MLINAFFPFTFFVVRGLRYFYHVIILPRFGSVTFLQNIVFARKA